jgi:hypothetical protein
MDGGLRSMIIVLALTAAACGSDSGGGGEPAADPSPFTFDRAAVPPGYELAVAGRGNQRPAWGSDSSGTDEPFTVLAPPGDDATSARAVVVSVTGFAGYEGGFDQAASGSRRIRIDGREARYGPAHDRDGRRRWADLVVRHGDDLAVRVTAPDATEDELVAVARRVQPARDHGRAPAVDDGGDLEVVGSVDADALVALDGGFAPFSDDVPGPEGSYSAGWVALPGRGSLVVQTVRGGAADLPALGGLEAFAYDQTFALRTVDDGSGAAVVVDRTYTGGGPSFSDRAVVVDAGDGQLVVVVARGPTVPEDAELLALAMTVDPVDPGTWEELVTEASGGPGLQPDPGATEITRGIEGGVGWLLQSWPDAASVPPRTGELLEQVEERPGPFVDTCLKLSTRHRACTAGAGAEAGLAYGYAQAEPDRGVDFPLFAILQTELPAATVRITTTTGTVTADLHDFAGGNRRVAVAFVDFAAYTGCDRLPRVEVLGADGAVLACPGG